MLWGVPPAPRSASTPWPPRCGCLLLGPRRARWSGCPDAAGAGSGAAGVGPSSRIVQRPRRGPGSPGRVSHPTAARRRPEALARPVPSPSAGQRPNGGGRTGRSAGRTPSPGPSPPLAASCAPRAPRGAPRRDGSWRVRGDRGGPAVLPARDGARLAGGAPVWPCPISRPPLRVSSRCSPSIRPAGARPIGENPDPRRPRRPSAGSRSVAPGLIPGAAPAHHRRREDRGFPCIRRRPPGP